MGNDAIGTVSAIKLSSPATREFWEIPVLFEDEYLLALDKPAGLAASPDRNDPQRPSLAALLHAAIVASKPWVRERAINYLMNANRLDSETSGVILFARSKAVLTALADLFGSEKPFAKYLALVHGLPGEDRFTVNAKLAPHPLKPDLMRVANNGKKSKTQFTVLERFSGYTSLKCEPLTSRLHQIRVHLRHAGLPIVGDQLYGGKKLWLSRLKPDYRLKPGREERPLISRPALHVEELTLPHPITGQALTIAAPCPKDLKIAFKYLRQYAIRDHPIT